jgi:hypothetical protein
MTRILSHLSLLNPEATIMGLPCYYFETEGDNDGYPVIHLIVNHPEVLAKGFPVTTLPVHVWIDSSSMRYSGSTVISARPRLLQDLSIGDDITAKGPRSAVLGCYLYSNSTTKTFGLTCGHLVIPHDTTNTSAQNSIPHEAISSPPLTAVEQIRKDKLMCLPNSLQMLKVRKSEEGETEGVLRHAAEIANKMVEEKDCNMICKEPSLLQVGSVVSGEVGYMAAPEIDSEHGVASPSDPLPVSSRSKAGSSTTSDSFPPQLQVARQQVADWLIFEVNRRAGSNPSDWFDTGKDLGAGMQVTGSVCLRRHGYLSHVREGIVNGTKAWVFKKQHLTLEYAVFSAYVEAPHFARPGDSGMVLTNLGQPVAVVFGGPENGPYALCTPIKLLLERMTEVTGTQWRLQPPSHHIVQDSGYPLDSIARLSKAEVEKLDPLKQKQEALDETRSLTGVKSPFDFLVRS